MIMIGLEASTSWDYRLTKRPCLQKRISSCLEFMLSSSDFCSRFISWRSIIPKFPEKTDFYKFYKSARSSSKGKYLHTRAFQPAPEYLDKLSEKPGDSEDIHPNLNSPSTRYSCPFRNHAFPPGVLGLVTLSLLSVWCGRSNRDHSDISRIQNSCKWYHQSTTRKWFRENQAPHDGWLDTHAVHLLASWIILLAYYPTWVNFQTGQSGYSC